MRLAIINHHGRKPAGAELSLMMFLEQLPADIEPVFFLFEEGEFTESVRRRYGAATVIPMSVRIASSTRKALRLDALWDTILLSKCLAGHIRRARVDVVLTNSVKAHVVGSFAAKALGLPCINYVHDALEGSAGLLVREVSRFLSNERLVCSRLADASLGLPRTTVLYDPIRMTEYADLPAPQAARAALGLPNDDLPVVGLVGRIAPWKGQDRFIRIATRVLRDADAHFVIIGGPIFGCEPEYPVRLRTMVKNANAEHRIHFIPWQDDLRNAYAALDVGCNCSTREPFGRTTIEALACGMPVVCFDDAGVCEVFGEHRGGRQIPAGNEDIFADAVSAYVRNVDVRKRTRGDALEAARRLDISTVSPIFTAAVARVGALHRQGNT